MCGIAGACWSPAHDASRVQERLSVSIAAMHNRGPDSAGQVLWRSPDGWLAALGSTRLAVLDLSPAGSQPMTSPDGRFTIVYNGEITNYIEVRGDLAAAGATFTSNGDTEVLLRGWEAWGSACVERLEGMYAFAVLDRATMTVTLCRDPFGIKPLYYQHVPGSSFAFGSEIASILPLVPGRPRLNWRTATRFLSSGYCDDSSDTFVEGINHLPPGAILTVDLRRGHVTYAQGSWRPDVRIDPSLSRVDAVEGVRSLFLASVERNLRADVPVGVALSGGIDSGAIACAVRAVDPEYPLRLFCYQSSDALSDELPWAQLVSSTLSSDLQIVRPVAADLLADTDDLILAQGEPFGSTSIYAQYRVFQEMHNHGVVVSLDGQGGDEVFAGYHGYAGQRIRSLLETGHVWRAAQFAHHWSQWPGRSPAKAAALTVAELAPAWAVSRASRMLPGYALPGVSWSALRERGLGWGWLPPSPGTDGSRGVRVKAELRSALTERGLQVLLRHGDRNSMRFSVESRVPFLDRPLVDFVLSFPEDWLVDQSGTSKAILRQAMRGLVPAATLNRRDKIGFEGDRAWIETQRPTLIDSIAAGADIGFLDKPALLAGLRSPGHRVPADMLWRVFNLYRWADLLGVEGT